MTDEDRAREALLYTGTSYLTPTQRADVDRVAAALSAAYQRGAEDMRDRAVLVCREVRTDYVNAPGPLWAAEIAQRIRELALPAAPAGEEREP